MEDQEQQEGAGNQQVEKKRVYGKPFQKGVSGNPSGRPKGNKSVTPVLRDLITDDNLKQIAQNLINDACRRPELRTMYAQKGAYEAYDPNEVKMYLDARATILERLDGKVTLPLAGDDGSALEIIIRHDKQAAHATD